MISITMPNNSLVIVRYGPYESCGIVEHRTLRLEGLKATLQDDGHQCIFQKSSDWNMVELIVNGECVFRCNIKYLDFGGDGKLDTLCQEAKTAVKNAY